MYGNKPTPPIYDIYDNKLIGGGVLKLVSMAGFDTRIRIPVTVPALLRRHATFQYLVN